MVNFSSNELTKSSSEPVNESPPSRILGGTKPIFLLSSPLAEAAEAEAACLEGVLATESDSTSQSDSIEAKGTSTLSSPEFILFGSHAVRYIVFNMYS